VGHNYAFGKGKKGTTDLLRRHGQKHGFRVKVVRNAALDGNVVSSSRVRSLLGWGRVCEAASYLGRPYSIEGTVIKGEGRGAKLLDTPTANISTPNELVPKEGVYAVRVKLGGKVLDGVANIGTNPTFGNAEPSYEVHIFDLEQNRMWVWGESGAGAVVKAVGVTSDQAGNVYVSDNGEKRVVVFDRDGKPVEGAVEVTTPGIRHTGCVQGISPSASAEGYTIVRLDTTRGKKQLSPVEVHLAQQPDTGRLAIIGIKGFQAADWDMIACMGRGSLYNYYGSLLSACGWIGAVMLICRTTWCMWLQDRFGALGQMAFTNYIMHSVVCTTIFYGHGFGRFGHIDRTGQALIVAGIVAFQLWFSTWWLTRYRFGPLEWLWRSLTYWKPQSMRRA